MPIKVSCPQCQTAYTFPDEKRGKQVRCKDCFQVFFAGDPPADASPEAAAPPEPPPAAARKPVVKAVVKPPAAAAPRPAPKPASKPPIRTAAVASNPVRPRPDSGSLRRPARPAPPPEPEERPRRRRRVSRSVMGLVGLVLVLLLVGGGAGVVIYAAITNRLPFFSAATPPDSRAAAPNPPKKDDKEPQKPDSPVEAPKPAAGSLAASLTQENFDKIDRGMTDAVLVERFGPPTSTEDSKESGADKNWVWKVAAGGPQVTVSMHGGRVVAKASNQDWPVVYPSGPAANPPPDKPAGAVTRANYDKIDKGMTEKQVLDLLGLALAKTPLPDQPGAESIAWADKDIAASVVLLNGKVAAKANTAGWPDVYPGDAAAKPPAEANPPKPADAAGNPPTPPPDKPAGKMTKANFDKIAKGMSLDDLTALVGQPNATLKFDPAKNAGVDTHLAYLALDASAGVDLFQGKVVNKINFQNWPVVWPADAAANPPDANPPKPGDAAGNPPPPPDKPTPGVNKNNYYRVTTGMADKDVIDLFGQPAQVRPGARPNETIATWLGNGAIVNVTTRDGRVLAKDNDQKWSNLAGPDAAKDPTPDKPAGGLTKVDFDKIDRDMSLNDLNTLLGAPTSALGKPANEVLTWKGEGSAVVVLVAQGKVLCKQSAQGWEVVYPADAGKNPPDDPRWSRENFDKIARDMSLDDVTAFLGPPGKAFTIPTADGGVEQIWESGGKQIVVTLRRGKVSDKADAQGWAIAWPGDVVKNPPPPPSVNADADVTQANFDKIAKGMTAREVNALVGSRLNANPILEGRTLNWASQDLKAVVTVTMQDGKVVDKTSTANWPVVWPGNAANNPPPDKNPPPAPPPPPPDKPDPAKFAAAVNKDNFDKIAKGMSEDDLVALFGPPAEAKPQPQPGVDERLTWQGGGAKILVNVKGAKVVSKLTTADWPVVYPK